MSLEELVVEKMRDLSPEKRKEVLDFVEFLKAKSASTAPRRELRGLWADLGIELSGQDIAEARREMWGMKPL